MGAAASSASAILRARLLVVRRQLDASEWVPVDEAAGGTARPSIDRAGECEVVGDPRAGQALAAQPVHPGLPLAIVDLGPRSPQRRRCQSRPPAPTASGRSHDAPTRAADARSTSERPSIRASSPASKIRLCGSLQNPPNIGVIVPQPSTHDGRLLDRRRLGTERSRRVHAGRKREWVVCGGVAPGLTEARARVRAHRRRLVARRSRDARRAGQGYERQLCRPSRRAHGWARRRDRSQGES